MRLACLVAWAAATAGLGSFVGWCVWTVLDMPSRVHAEVNQYYAKGMVRTELDFHVVRALEFVVPLAIITLGSAALWWSVARHARLGPGPSRGLPRPRLVRAVPAVVLVAGLVVVPVLASQGPPAHGAAEATGGPVLVPDWPPWYDSGFWTVGITVVPGAVYLYLASTCPTSHYCMAWGQTPAWKSIFMASTDGGADWHQVGTNGVFPVLGNIACWDTTHCLVAGSPPELTTDGGHHWAAVGAGDGNGLAALCPRPRSCLLLNYWGGKTSVPDRVPIMVTHDGGATWAPANVPAGAWSLFSGACASASDCFAAGHRGMDQTGVGAILSSHDGGRNWSSLPVPKLMADVTTIACATPQRCVVAGNIGKMNARGATAHSDTRLFATKNGGTTWEQVRGLAALGTDPGTARLACTESTCISLFGDGPPWKAFLSLDAGSTWEPSELASALGRSYVGSLYPLSCNPGGLCTLVGDRLPEDGGFVFYSSDGGLSWLRGLAGPVAHIGPRQQ